MNCNKISHKSSLPLSRIFDKFGDIICEEWNKNNMKVPSYSYPPAVWSRSSHAQDSDTLVKNNNNVLCYTDGTESSEKMMDCRDLMDRLEQTLREAKLLSLHCGEVLLPHDLIYRISEQIVSLAENEPCGLKGCLIYITLQDKKLERKRVGVVKCDPNTLATFEIHITLFQDSKNWWSLRHLIPDKLLESMGKRSSLVLGSHFLLDRKKLYRSSSQS